MTEVKRRNGIPSMPIRNPPSFNHSSSSSYKHIYDDVFASPLQSRQQSTAFVDDDYAEMFGSSRSNNGTWSISYSSIPVLDLPPPTEMRVRGVSGVTTVSGERAGGNLDYSGVFGGFGDGNFGLPDGEELFDQLKKKTKTSTNAIPSTNRGKEQTTEATRPEMFRQSETQSIDNLQDFKRNKKEDVMKKSGEIKKAARARDFPGTTNKVEVAVPAQTTLSGKIPVIKDDDTQLGKDVDLAVKQGKHEKHISMDLGADVKNNDSVFRKDSGLSASNSNDNVHDTSQSAAGSISIFPQPSAGSSNSLSETSDGKEHFDHMNNKMHNIRTSEPIRAAEVHAIPECTSTLHETEPTHLSSKMSVIEDNIETKTNVNMSEQPGQHSISTCSEPKVSLNNGEPFSLDTSQDTPQVTMETEVSKKVNDDVTINFDVKRKGRRHFRITSLDLGDRKHSHEQDGQSQRKPRFGGSYSFDGSNDSHAARVKVHPSMMAPSSSVPQFFPVESHYKISENSTWRNFGSSVYRDGSVSPPSLEEHLDKNSAAAMSAVALQRAIEEASMIFQMAKEYLERESQGSSEVRFKDTLKVKVAKDEQFADEMDEFQHYTTYESCPPKDTDKPKLSFVKDTLKVKVSKDNQLEDEMNRFQQPVIHKICPPRECEKERLLVSERPSVMENGQSSQVFEDLKKVSNDMPTVQDQNNKNERHKQHTIVHDNSLQGGSGMERPSFSVSTSVLEDGLPSRILEDPKKPAKNDHVSHDGKNFVHYEGRMEERNPDMSKYTDERDRQEGGAGGEWEAAKHLNQLICGVKNKIASFMAWQTDTEKKEDLKETEACKRSHLQSEGGPDLVDMEHAEIKTKLTDQVRSCSPGEHVEMEIGFLSEIVDPCEDVSVWNNTAGQEKAESNVDLNPVVASSSPESLMFFPFRNEKVHDPMDTNQEQNIGSEECSEIEFMNVQDDVLSEMKYEQLQDKCEENDHEALDDTSITQNPEVLDDDFTNQNSVELDDPCTTNHGALNDSDIEVINKTVEEPCLLAGKEKNESTDEDPKRSLDEESREDPVHDSHYPESTAESIDENINCGEAPKRCLDEECREDPLHDSHFPEITTENIDESGNCEEYDVTKESENWQHDAQILEETDPERDVRKGIQAFEETHEFQEIERDQSQTSHIEEAAGQMHGCNEFMTDDTLDDHIEEIEVAEKESFSSEDACMKCESSCIEVITEESTEEASFVTEVLDELTKTENELVEDTTEQVASFGTVEDDFQKAEHVCLSESEGPFMNDHGSGMVEEVVSSDEVHDSTMEILKSSSEAKSKKEETIIFYDSFVELDGITEDLDDDADVDDSDDDDETLEVENFGLHSSQGDVYLGKDEVGANVTKTESRDILENQTEHVLDSEESLDVGVAHTITDQEGEKCGVDAVQKRRRWFDNGVKVGLAERPSILEGDITEVETDPEAVDESILAGSVEIHSDELDRGRQEVNQESVSVNSESTPKRRRWSVKIGEEGLPVPPPLFQGINVEEPQTIVNETLPQSKSESSLGKLNATEADVSVSKEKDKSSVEAPPRRKRWFASGDNVGPISQPISTDDAIDQDSQVMGGRENHKCDDSTTAEETEVEPCKMEEVNDRHVDEANRKEKERMVVERAIREARERAFAEARDRARRDSSERQYVEVRQKVGAGAQERAGKVPAEARGPSDKVFMDAKLKAERAAVERATAEARERALQKALSEKAPHRSREQKNASDPNFQSSSSFSRADMSSKGEKYDGFDSESAQRRKTRTERQSRTTEQPATALDEKNRRDLLVQKEQAAKNMMAESLDAELKRWSAGKEGNLRLLLSTLQYILGPESGWQAVTLTDLMAATAVRKAYKKATLCVHPDKLQQRGATIQQKYICERVFDLLKDAWSKLNPNER